MLRDFFDRPFVLPASVLGGCLIVGTGIVASTFYSIRSLSDVIVTTGSATQEVVSDRAKWTVSVHRTAGESGLSSAYTAVAADTSAVESFLIKGHNIDPAGITETAIFSDQDYYSSDANAPKRYNVHQEITVNVTDVEKVAALAKDISSLVAQGVVVSPQAPEYFISTLPELRISLLGKATQDAKARAEQLVQGSGAHIGKLRSATSAAVQVLAPNSTDVSDYGSYDTSTIRKTVMVTVRATFSVK